MRSLQGRRRAKQKARSNMDERSWGCVWRGLDHFRTYVGSSVVAFRPAANTIGRSRIDRSCAVSGLAADPTRAIANEGKWQANQAAHNPRAIGAGQSDRPGRLRAIPYES